MKDAQKHQRKSLALFLAGNLCLVSLVIGVVGYQLFETRDHLIQKRKDEAMNTALLTEETILASLRAIDIVMEQISYAVKTQASLTEGDRAHFLQSIGADRGVRLTWTDEEGTPLGAEFADKHLIYADRDYFKDLRESPPGTSVMTNPIRSRLTGDWVVIKAKRLSDQAGTFKGVIIVALTPSFFDQIRRKINVSPHNSFAVGVGTVPHYLFRFPEAPAILGRQMVNDSASAVLDRHSRAAVYETHSPVDGTHRATAFSWVGDEPMLIVLGFDLTSVLSEWLRSSLMVMLMTLFGTVSFVCLNIYVLKSTQAVKSFQAQLVSSAKLAALGEMAASIAHEINNPLAVIRLNVDFLKTSAGLEGELFKRIVSMDVTADRINAIVKGLLSFGRDSSSDPFSRVALGSVISDTLAFSTDRLKRNDVTLKMAVDEAPIMIMARSTELSQVLVNLLNNAGDAVRELSERWVKISTTVRAEVVEIRITDSGPGLPKEIQEKMFNPFFTTKKAGDGNGLGLSIAIGIIKAHGGTLTLDTTAKNTCFLISLPLADREVPDLTRKEAA